MSIPGTTLLRYSAALALALSGACATDVGDDPSVDEDPAVQTGDEFAVNAVTPGDPLPGLTEEQLEDFEEGLEDFAEVEEVDEGLGPVFNNTGCGVCHDAAATGGASSAGLVEIRYGHTDENGVFDPLGQFGGSLQQLVGIGPVDIPGCEGVNFAQETIPAEANTQGGRLTTPLFGLGLVEAIPDNDLVVLSILEQIFTPGTAGRPSMVTTLATGEQRVGRFGWKAPIATLFDFSGDAYLNEMGITNPLLPAESCFNGDCELTARCDPTPDPEDDGTALNNFTNFMTFLAPLPTAPANATAQVGAVIFAGLGCTSCHNPSFTTPSNPIAALSNKSFSPYSDFLLHDMGTGSDMIEQGGTRATEIRTAPLWGARFRVSFLHDGRARTVRDAILGHTGQGQRAANDFASLPGFFKNAVVAFVNTL
jgi:CxxC motif-containing protein (DUF1111 family)